METESTRAISEVKQELRLREWSEQIERQQSSGMSVEQWCIENRINPKTYYYRLRRVREQCVAAQPSMQKKLLTNGNVFKRTDGR